MRTLKLEEKLKIRNSLINIENERMSVDISFPSLHPPSNSIILPASAQCSVLFGINNYGPNGKRSISLSIKIQINSVPQKQNEF